MSSRLTVPVGPDDHVEGDDGAEITLVEYGDYECPYCGQAYPIVKELQRVFGTSLRLVFRNMPLANVHPYAERAAEAAEAVALQGKFWPMHDLLFENQEDLEEHSLLRYAHEAGADSAEVASVLASGTTRRRINNDIESAVRSGVNGTPTFFVNAERYDGSWAYEPFYDFLKDVLSDL
ncbi:MAG: thioredoxin domain-containing protein [Acidimicrobiales bacterium]